MAGLLNINSGHIAPTIGQISDLPFSSGILILKWSGSNSICVVAISDTSINTIINVHPTLFGIGSDADKIINVYKDSGGGNVKIKYEYDTDGYEISWASLGF